MKVILLDDIKMREIGFTDHNPQHWYFTSVIAPGTSFDIIIDKDTGNYETNAIDNFFGQPAYYYSMGKPDFRSQCIEKIDIIVQMLKTEGLDIEHDHTIY